MKAEIITIGDEILRGEIVDSNKALIAEQLLGLNVECHYQSSVRDDRDDMAAAFRLAAERADVVLVSGGLGPTRDDITTEVLAETFGRALVLDDSSLQRMEAFFRRLGREMAETNRKQAYFPESAEILDNPVGTAPGFMMDVEGVPFFCMPGVPRELSPMMVDQVLPRIAERVSGGALFVRARILKTFGIGESSLEAELADLARSGDVEIGFRTTFPDNYLRVVARGSSAGAADERIADVVLGIEKRLGDLVYGEGDDTMAGVVGQLLSDLGRTLAVAESCTGGGLAERVTAEPGSSGYFLGGVVAYANEIKSSALGVSESLLAEYGAVSDPVAEAMAEGVRQRFGADYGIATTGISGPGGGSDSKPVGQVHIALARANGTHVDGFVFALDRSRHRALTAQVGLDWLRRDLTGLPLVAPSLMRQPSAASAAPKGTS